MDIYSLLKFAHIIGFILLGGGLLAVFMSELEAYRTKEMKAFVEAARYTARFYDGLVIPGAITVAISGYFLLDKLGLGFFDAPWIIGMWGLFLFEFVEGNTVTRLQFRKTLRLSQKAQTENKALTEEVRHEARTLLNQVVHFLDLPMFAVIVYCGTVRPDTWGEFFTVFTPALVVTALLVIFVPRLAGKHSQQT